MDSIVDAVQGHHHIGGREEAAVIVAIGVAVVEWGLDFQNLDPLIERTEGGRLRRHFQSDCLEKLHEGQSWA